VEAPGSNPGIPTTTEPHLPGLLAVRQPTAAGEPMDLADLQDRIEATFGARDRARGVDGTFRWWVEEVGEVAKALRTADPAALEHELGDALAWLVSVANVAGVDLERAAARYADGCPRCRHSPCTCAVA
jgi:NTP pyrophosphatase (non-canonical NTP hydrolase)